MAVVAVYSHQSASSFYACVHDAINRVVPGVYDLVLPDGRLCLRGREHATIDLDKTPVELGWDTTKVIRLRAVPTEVEFLEGFEAR